MILFQKRFDSLERLIRDLDGRDLMPSSAIPKIYSVDPKNLVAEYQYLNTRFNIRENNDLIKLVEFLLDVHLYIETQVNERTHNGYEKENKEFRRTFNLPLETVPVRIGDLKPEHLFLGKKEEIIICDYETVGTGLFLEDLVSLHVCCELNDSVDIETSVLYYFERRFSVKDHSRSKIFDSMLLTVKCMAARYSLFERYIAYWEVRVKNCQQKINDSG